MKLEIANDEWQVNRTWPAGALLNRKTQFRTKEFCQLINLKDKGDHLDFVSEGQGTMGKRLANAYLSMY